MPDLAWLGAIYQQFRRELFRTAWTVLRRSDLAEDAVHAAFVRLVGLGRQPAEPKLYVFRSVRNAAIDLARARSRRREEPLPIDYEEPSPPDTDAAETLALIQAALDQLDDASREVVELHLHAKLTFLEIGQLLGEPLPTVASRYRRALEKLGKECNVCHE